MSAGGHSNNGSATVHYPMHRGGAYVFKKHHRKPYRKRHIALVLVMYLISLGSGIGLGLIAGRLSSTQEQVNQSTTAAPLKKIQGQQFQLTYDPGTFIESSSTIEGKTIQLLRPDPVKSEGRLAASRFSIATSESTKTNLLSVFAPLSDELFSVSSERQSDEVLGGVLFEKYVHEHTPLYSDTAAKVYSLQWLGYFEGIAYAISVEGLIDSADTPAVYEPVFASLAFGSTSEVLGLSVSDVFKKEARPAPLSDRYVADAISPAVVKIYNVVCGVVFVEGRQASQDGCKAVVGSGFFVSSDGYIATNGHVVVFEPEDAFVQLLFNEPQVFADYLRNNGLTSEQIEQLSQRPDLLAAVVAEIYALPEGTIELKNREHIILVAQGEDPLQAESLSNYRELAKLKETDTLKRAQLVAADYSPRDIYVVSSGSNQGFSSSDVALLKVDINNAPYIKSVDGSIVTQNQAISVLGFPSDAENALINNTQLAVTVTNGTISSIRTAAGSDYKLYQSDADASQGNSGGPAVTSDGKVFGLLTYRFKNEAVQDAAKSYIRDFTDIKRLALANGISFNQTGDVQDNWELGLRYFAAGYYSTALDYFKEVQRDFPSHRLAPQYIAASNQAIESGRDVQASTINYLAIGLIVGMVGGAGATVLIVRHHARHKIYRFHFPHATHHA